MRVLLVRPWYYVGKLDIPYVVPEPIGIEYLAGYIAGDHEVRVLDLIGSYWWMYEKSVETPEMYRFGGGVNELASVLKDFRPDVVGVSSLFLTQEKAFHEVAIAVKQFDKKITVVAGGPHPSSTPEMVLNANSSIDVIVVGEGEETFKELLASGFKNLELIKGLAFRREGKVVITPMRPPIDIASAPSPRRDLIPFKNFKKMRKYAGFSGVFGREKALSLMRVMHNSELKEGMLDALATCYKRWKGDSNYRIEDASIITSRGCPCTCTFCAIQNVWGSKYRMYPAEKVLEEISSLYHEYGARHILIMDDNFTANKKRTLEICRGIVKRNLNLRLTAPSGIYMPSLDEEVIAAMKQAGFAEVYLGIESGNQNTLDNIIRKKLDLSKVGNIVDLCRKHGIKTGGFFIIGFPDETVEAMKDTIEFAVNSGIDNVRLYLFQPFPGSEMYRYMTEKGYLSDDYDVTKTNVVREEVFVKSPNFTAHELLGLLQHGRELLNKRGQLAGPFKERKSAN